jgi:Glyoxalase-like domain
VTHLVPVPDVEEGREWYASLLGREPDVVPVSSVYEWKLRDGVWLQIAEGTVAEGETGQLLRLGVSSIDAAVAAFTALGGEPEARADIPGIIAIQDLRDPFGNRLCFYEESRERN